MRTAQEILETVKEELSRVELLEARLEYTEGVLQQMLGVLESIAAKQGLTAVTHVAGKLKEDIGKMSDLHP